MATATGRSTDRRLPAAAASRSPRRVRSGAGRRTGSPAEDDLITLYGFGNIFPAGRGETKDLRAQWALEESGLPYRVHALDHAGGELGDVERRLEDPTWIACADFTVADIMMAGVLRGIRKTGLMDPFPRMKAYFERCQARPAWQRTLGLYAERLGVDLD